MTNHSPKDPASAHTEVTPVMNGRLDEVHLPELVQMFAAGSHAVQIRLESDDGSTGFVGIRDGRVGECHFEGLLGEEAFFRLCRIEGTFHVQRTSGSSVRTAIIGKGWQELVMEAARQQDEDNRHSRVLRFPDRANSEPEDERERETIRPSAIDLVPQGQSVARTFEEIFAEATRAYLIRDLPLARSLFRECLRLRPADRRAQANLNRLEGLGIER